MNLFQPAEFEGKLLDGEGDDPDGFVIAVADLAEDGAERGAFAGELEFEEAAAALELAAEGSGAGEPGKSHPCAEGIRGALGGPPGAFECAGEGAAAARSGGVDAGRRAARRAQIGSRRHDVNQPEARQFFQRIVNLRAGDAGPIADLAAFEFEIGLIAVHGLFGEEREKDEVGGGEGAMGDAHHCCALRRRE